MDERALQAGGPAGNDMSETPHIAPTTLPRRSSDVERVEEVRSWLERIKSVYVKFTAAFIEKGVYLDEIDDGLSEKVISGRRDTLPQVILQRRSQKLC